MSSLLLLSGLVLAGDVDRVPKDFPTIQQAVDKGTAPVIEVAAGTWAGAVVDRPVSILGAPGASITRGVKIRPGARAAFGLTGAADGAEIHGFHVDCTTRALDLGVYASVPRLDGAAQSVVVAHNTFEGCVQGITNAGSPVATCSAPVDGGSYWVIENNVFDGFPTVTDTGGTGGGIGVMVFNATGADIVNNRFQGQVQDTHRFSTTGINLAGCVDCTVAANDFAVTGGTHFWTAVSNNGFAQAGGSASSGLILADNDASADSAPQLGVNFRSIDSFDTQLDDNKGTSWIDHAHCGDGVIQASVD